MRGHVRYLGNPTTLGLIVAMALLGPGCRPNQPPPTPGGATVDLFLTSNAPAIDAGMTGSKTFTIGNSGAASTNDIEFTYATGPFINLDHVVPLPAGCDLVYQNDDRTVPEVVHCRFSGLMSDETRSFSIAVAVSDKAPTRKTYGIASVVPALDGADVEGYITDNIISASVLMHRVTPLDIGETNLFVTTDIPGIAATTPTVETITVGNNGPASTTAPSVVTMATPFYVNVDHTRSLPAGCTMLLEDARPIVPEIVQCTVPSGLDSGATHAFAVPLTLVPGGPIGRVQGILAVRATDGSGDVDPDRADNMTLTAVLVLAPEPPVGITHGPVPPVMPPPFTVPPGSATGDGAGALIDLSLARDQPYVQAGSSTVQTFYITNHGADATAPVRLLLATPIFAHVDRTRPLPGTCAFLYVNTDFTVPEIVECVVPGPPHGATVIVPVPLIISPDAPAVQLWGTANVLPASSSKDIEQDLNDNFTGNSVSVVPGERRGRPVGNTVDLFWTTAMSDITALHGTSAHFHIGNKGPAATQGVTRFTFATPFFVNVDSSRPLPSGCTMLYTNLDPAVYEVGECLITSAIAPGTGVDVDIPLAPLPGALSGSLWSKAIVRPQSSTPDVERDFTDNIVDMAVMASRTTPRPQPHNLVFYLHGQDIPRTDGGFTMNQTVPPPQLLSIQLGAASWFSDPTSSGVYAPDATFHLVLPCSFGLGVLTTFTLASTDLDGGAEVTLGQASEVLSLCLGSRTVTIPVALPVAFDQRRLKLTIATLLKTTLDLELGPGARIETTQFSGSP